MYSSFILIFFPRASNEGEHGSLLPHHWPHGLQHVQQVLVWGWSSSPVQARESGQHQPWPLPLFPVTNHIPLQPSQSVAILHGLWETTRNTGKLVVILQKKYYHNMTLASIKSALSWYWQNLNLTIRIICTIGLHACIDLYILVSF